MRSFFFFLINYEKKITKFNKAFITVNSNSNQIHTKITKRKKKLIISRFFNGTILFSPQPRKNQKVLLLKS